MNGADGSAERLRVGTSVSVNDIDETSRVLLAPTSVPVGLVTTGGSGSNGFAAGPVQRAVIATRGFLSRA